MSRILLTAFEPFRGRKGNISRKNIGLEVSKRIDEKGIAKLLFPVVFDDFRSEIEYAKSLAPDYVLMLGESGRYSPELEKKAKNLIKCEGSPDNHGRIIDNAPVIKRVPAYYLATLPSYEKMIKMVNKEIIKYAGKKGHEIVKSDDAGEYVCNSLFYKFLHEFRLSKTKVGFLHIPYSMNVNESTDIIYLMLDYLKNDNSGGIRK